MRILQINKYITINGGSEVVMKNLYEIFSLNNFHIKNIGFHKPNQRLIDNSIDLGVENLEVQGFFVNKKLVSIIVDYILKEKIDTVICHNVYHHFPIYQLFKEIKEKCDVQIILYLHDYKIVCPSYNLLRDSEICESCSNKSFFAATLYKCKDNSLMKSFVLTLESIYNNKIHDAYDYVDKIISPSLFLKEKVKALGFRHKIEVLHNPLDVTITSEAFSKKENSLLFVGRLSEEKGIRILLELAKQLTQYEIKIIGDGPLKELLVSEVNSLENVQYYGYQEKRTIESMMKRSKYLLVPSIWYENNPMVILEAFSMGLPVIGANRGGIPELIVEGRGISFEPKDIDESIKIINTMMLKSEEEYGKLSEACQNFAKENYYTAYYHKLIKILGNKNEK